MAEEISMKDGMSPGLEVLNCNQDLIDKDDKNENDLNLNNRSDVKFRDIPVEIPGVVLNV